MENGDPMRCWDMSNGNCSSHRLLHSLSLAPLPLTTFRSNSKFDQNLQCSGLKYSIDHIEILLTSRQLYYNDVCKISLWSIKYILK